MKHAISILLVLALLCSFGAVFAQEEAPAEETAEEIADTVPAEPVQEETAEEIADTVPAEPVQEETAEEIAEAVPEGPVNEEIPAEESASVVAGAEPAVTQFEAEPAADGAAGSGTCGDGLTWEMDSETQVLTVSGQGAMTDYDSDAGYYAPWYKDRGSVKSVVIEDGVTSVGSAAFYSCINLSSVTIADSVTKIGSGAFQKCRDLKNVTFPGNLTEIGSRAFFGCDSLENIYYGGSDKASVAVEDGNTCLDSAVWHYGRYVVRYDANGGTGAPKEQRGTVGEELRLSSVIPVRVGYDFLGWAVDKAARAADHEAGSAWTPEGEVTLYAVWEKAAAVPLTSGRAYTADVAHAGGKLYYEFTPTGNKTYVLYSTGSKAVSVTLYDDENKVLAAGSKGNGRLAYAMKAGETYMYEIAYADAAATGNIAFRFGRVYSVTYNANGGSGAPAAQTKDYGKNLTLSGTVPTRCGYTFLGWSASETASAATYKAGASYTANGNVTLYAVWESCAEALTSGGDYTADITTSDGKAYYTFTAAGSKTYVIYSTGKADTKVTLYDENGAVLASDDNSGAGKNFRLACSVTAGKTYIYEIAYTDAAAAGKIAFRFGRSYSVTYNANGGSGAPAAQEKDYAAALTLSSTVPTRPGYTFLGWATTAGAADAAYAAGGSYTADGNVTLYAVWKYSAQTLTANRTYTAAITAAGAKIYYEFTPTASKTYVIFSTGSADTKVRLYDTEGNLLATNDNGGDGSNFRLSYALTAGETYIYSVYYPSSSATGKITFGFGRIYKVTYNTNGGTGAPTSQTKDYSEALTLSSTIPTRKGYTFLGWSAVKTATAATYKAGGSYTVNSNVTLYAVWKKNS